jgi:histidine ammonia-lyase
MAILKETYTLAELLQFFRSGEKLELSASTKEKVAQSVAFLTQYLHESKTPVYGVNTGFGSLQNVSIPEDELHELQRNLLITHAAGVGKVLPAELSRMMLLLKILNIAKGHSAVRQVVLDRMLLFYSENLTPEVHEQGSLGASGDLAPLAELALPLIGMGRLQHPQHGTMDTAEVLAKLGLEPLVLNPKEALALINGTQFMLAHALILAEGILGIRAQLARVAGLSTDMYLCRPEPFWPQLHSIRPHAGQRQSAAEMLEILSQSPMQAQPRPAVQDPYSFRCIPQVHGASYAAFDHCLSVWETELNSVTDNPNVFIEDGLILSGGNFHGQPLALTLDYAAMALSEIGSISERRTYLLISGQRGLPPFLSPNPGTDSGYMIAQYTAASLASQNKQLCTPASVDSIVSSNGQEDHVSMGANAAIKSLAVLQNVQNILAIEFLCGAQARNLRNSPGAQQTESLTQSLALDVKAHFDVPMYLLMSRAGKVLWG